MLPRFGLSGPASGALLDSCEPYRCYAQTGKDAQKGCQSLWATYTGPVAYERCQNLHKGHSCVSVAGFGDP